MGRAQQAADAPVGADLGAGLLQRVEEVPGQTQRFDDILIKGAGRGVY